MNGLCATREIALKMTIIIIIVAAAGLSYHHLRLQITSSGRQQR